MALERLLDPIMTAQVENMRPNLGHLRSLWLARAGAWSLVRNLDRKRVDRFLMNGLFNSRTISLGDEKSPHHPKEMEFINNGKEQLVFKTLFNGSPVALKINREFLFASDKQSIIDRITRTYRDMVDLYASLPGLIPEETFVYPVVNRPPFFRQKTVFANIQPFFGDKILGVFERFSPEEWMNYLSNHPDVEKTFKSFAALTVKSWDNGNGWALDIDGYKMLVLVEGENPKLVAIDPHQKVDRQMLLRYDKERRNRFKQRMQYLEGFV